LNVLRLTEPRSAVTEIDLSNTPLTLRQAKLHGFGRNAGFIRQDI
jgi:hypothetical protein